MVTVPTPVAVTTPVALSTSAIPGSLLVQTTAEFFSPFAVVTVARSSVREANCRQTFSGETSTIAGLTVGLAAGSTANAVAEAVLVVGGVATVSAGGKAPGCSAQPVRQATSAVSRSLAATSGPSILPDSNLCGESRVTWLIPR
jgi:hypothetical protein